MQAATLLAHLRVVDDERKRRAANPALNEKVGALKTYQQRRFALTYADLLASDRYAAAARYFLAELYGPSDFSSRDAQVAAVAPTVAQLFPEDIAATVATLSELHALSETLDSAMGLELESAAVTRAGYMRAWQQVGRPQDRERQVALTLAIADRLDRFTRQPLFRTGLHLMRGPALAAGLSDLQQLLEEGFDTFRAMQGADQFIEWVGARERALAAALFTADPKKAGSVRGTDRALAWLPEA